MGSAPRAQHCDALCLVKATGGVEAPGPRFHEIQHALMALGRRDDRVKQHQVVHSRGRDDLAAFHQPLRLRETDLVSQQRVAA